MINLFKIKLGSFYILTPENACCATTFDKNIFEKVWQYGSNEAEDKVCEQDGVAPQCGVKNLPKSPTTTLGRIYIPDTEVRRIKAINNDCFLDLHSVKNYDWIFKTQFIPKDTKGYVESR